MNTNMIWKQMLICNVKLLTKEKIANKIQWTSMTNVSYIPVVWPGLSQRRNDSRLGRSHSVWVTWWWVDFSRFLRNYLCVGGDVREGIRWTRTNTHTWAGSAEKIQLGSLRQEARMCPFPLGDQPFNFSRVLPLCWAGWPYHNLVQLIDKADMQMKM